MWLLSVLAFPLLVALEIAGFIVVGQRLGVLATIGLLFLTGAAGLILVAAQGIHHLNRLQSTLARGELPVADMVHGLLLLIAGFLLFIPGFVTDVLGLLLLLPPIRAVLGRGLLRRWQRQMRTRRTADGGIIIEGEYQESGPPPPPPGRLPPRDG